MPNTDSRPPEWAGGDAAFRRLIDAFYDRVERDELLSALFPGGVTEEHRANVTRWWVEVFGGPATYTEGFGGEPTDQAQSLVAAQPHDDGAERATTSIKSWALRADDAHRDLAITPEQRSLRDLIACGRRAACPTTPMPGRVRRLLSGHPLRSQLEAGTGLGAAPSPWGWASPAVQP